jgi:uncharacterized protein
MSLPDPAPADIPTPAATPTRPRERIVLLDALRGFALLGILLMNILGFGLLSPAYSNPGFDVAPGAGADFWAWALVELFGEGSMRGLFSLLFGAGLVLFTTGSQARGAAVHYRRVLFLLLFGLFDAYVLLWFGDILVCYAICGALLYPLRDRSPRTLLILALLIGLLSSLSYAGLYFLLDYAKAAADTVAASPDPSALGAQVLEPAAAWDAFSADYLMGAAQLAEEQLARGGSYLTAFRWNAGMVNGMLFFVLPAFLLWDALMMMLLGMALYGRGVLRGGLSRRSAALWAAVGLGSGLAVNAAEVAQALRADLDLLAVFAQLKWSYHLGRVAMTLGYVGLIAWLLQAGILAGLLRRLAAVGRMALSNYLLHSLIALLLFTGAGLGLVGELSRAQLYAVVPAIWLLQLWLSPRWLSGRRFGPLEYLWRWLTYGRRPSGQ